ncbi:MAG: DUF4276 family protein [Proteobacteria bacterium]|nr:DUF4276 family protein [Pseudomonadota bacterium]MBU1715654.1 DUF4276 family protein [Pseudomonadota bacterium]
MTLLYVATEDALSESVVDCLVMKVNHDFLISVRLGRRGNSYLRAKLPELIKLARNIPVLLLTDLDMIECPSTLISNWSGGNELPNDLLFRVAVREIESWLLADRNGFSDFFDVPLSQLPPNPENIDDPKQLLLKLVRRYSNREIKAAILPERGVRSKIGFGYNQMLGRFVEEQWSIDRAMTNSESLAKAYQRLNELHART